MNFKYYWFLFKWFLIGKYHCDLPAWSKRYFNVAHKILWAFIGTSGAFTLYQILEFINP